MYSLTVSEATNWNLTNITVTARNEDGELSEDIGVSVDHTSPAVNTSLPRINVTSLSGNTTRDRRLSVSIMDNTPDEEINFISQVDGEETRESYSGKATATIDLQEGKHKYVFYAIDMAGNKSSAYTNEITLFPKQPTIRMINPSSGVASISLPPDNPDGGFVPRYNVEFEVYDLPNGDYTLLKEVKIRNNACGTKENAAGGCEQTLNSFTEARFSFDIPIARKKPNMVTITVIDQSGTVVTKEVTIVTR
jgi:hypothetical protein